ncbi:hypothetical protein AB0N07_15120 [Streptomyces sp. NPDC051172]|uniref:hypothetical protein n=1 Tax=Streptomyces sp. NPDC051172 TaxID=3155796 RepID=UPI00343814FC
MTHGSNGTSTARTTLSAYPGETPVLNFLAQSESSSNRGLQLNADHWHVRGERNSSFDTGTSVFRTNISCRFRVSGTNGSLGWSLASDGHLAVAFGGKAMTP